MITDLQKLQKLEKQTFPDGLNAFRSAAAKVEYQQNITLNEIYGTITIIITRRRRGTVKGSERK